MAFVFRIPGFESAPAMMACWTLPLIVAAMIGKRYHDR
jgi:hypothetical protein